MQRTKTHTDSLNRLALRPRTDVPVLARPDRAFVDFQQSGHRLNADMPAPLASDEPLLRRPPAEMIAIGRLGLPLKIREGHRRRASAAKCYAVGAAREHTDLTAWLQ